MTRRTFQTAQDQPDRLETIAKSGVLDAIEVAGGSVCGREHARLGRGSQDALCWKRTSRAIVAVVSDGCGSGRHSEVGAKLGSRLYVEALSRRLEHGADPVRDTLWRGARVEVLARLRSVAGAMGGELAAVVSDYFLFTIVGAVLTPNVTAIFALGDGLYGVNGEVSRLGPFANNCPPYLGYGLLEARGRETAHVEPLVMVPTPSVDNLLLATDGAVDLLDSEEPGEGGTGGALTELWSRDRYFANSDGIRRRLALLNREVVDIDWEEQRMERSTGLLTDDTTIIAMRRRSDAGRDRSERAGEGESR